MAQAVLRSCEAAVKLQLQKFLTTLILSPISSNSDLHQHCYTLIYQVTRRQRTLYGCPCPFIVCTCCRHLFAALLCSPPVRQLYVPPYVAVLFTLETDS
jgi:hypothetical protein